MDAWAKKCAGRCSAARTSSSSRRSTRVYTGATVASLVGAEIGGPTLTIAGNASALAEAGTEVVVDFTRIEAARQTLAVCAAAGIHAVVGTTGVTPGDLDDWRRLFAGPTASAPNCVVAANFAIGAVLLMRFCELAAPHFESVEIVELHHDGKLDAPVRHLAAHGRAHRRRTGRGGQRRATRRPDDHHRGRGGARRGGTGRGAYPFAAPARASSPTKRWSSGRPVRR